VWATGKRAWALCQICGRRFTHPQLQKNDQGLMVCEADYDGAYGLQNHPQNGPFPVSPDPIALPYVLPDVYFNNPAVGADNTINVVVSTTVPNFNMVSAARAAGWNLDPSRQIIFTFTTASRVGSSSTSIPALQSGIWPTMAVLPIIRSFGIIAGRGGTGGAGGDVFLNTPDGKNGTDGGIAVSIGTFVVWDNYGIIGGGGGGGNGGPAWQIDLTTKHGGNGGGGGGGIGYYVVPGGGLPFPTYQGGQGGGRGRGSPVANATNGAIGQTGTYVAGGAADAFSPAIYGQGGGGDLGENGHQGIYSAPVTALGTVGTPGVAGDAIIGSSYIQWVNRGTILGDVT